MFKEKIKDDDYFNKYYPHSTKQLEIENYEKKLMRFKYNILKKCNYISLESDKDFLKFQNFKKDESSAQDTNMIIRSYL